MEENIRIEDLVTLAIQKKRLETPSTFGHIILEFSFSPQWRHQRHIARAVNTVCDTLRMPKNLVGGGFGCFWVALDISSLPIEELIQTREKLRKILVSKAVPPLSCIRGSSAGGGYLFYESLSNG